jgi:SPP1 gp7 family putative phage head morphogenesis protein
LLKEGYDFLVETMGEVGSLTITDPRVEAYINFRQSVYAQGMTETMQNAVNHQIRLGLEAQETTTEIGLRISGFFDGASVNHGKLIAQTETTSAFNKAQIDGMNDLDIPFKIWISQRDSRVRVEHSKLDGEIVETNKNFSNGLDHPSQINCRCYINGVREK